jgi:putative serine protease PepD
MSRTLSRGAARHPIALALAAAALAAATVLVALSLSHNVTHAAGPTPVQLPPLGAQTAGLQQQYVRIIRAVSPKVVQIQTSIGLGSGIVFDHDGDIVTNAHVVRGAHAFTVTLPAGRRIPATLVGADMGHDIAVVRLEEGRPAPATFDTGPSRIGDLVLAIGNPLGLRSSVTEGIVSSLGRTVSEGGGVTLSPVIQTSAAINPGNSGGALVDLRGRVVGIPTLAALDPEMGGAASGIGFAIPSGTAERIASGLIAARHR